MIGHKKVLTACFAALLGLGLAACGTTGDDAALVIEPDPTPEMVAATMPWQNTVLPGRPMMTPRRRTMVT